MVRFEDQELNGDTVQSLKARQLDNLTSKVIHEKSSKVAASSHDISRRSFRSNSIDRLSNIGSLSLRELKNLSLNSENIPRDFSKSSPVSSPIKFKSTFPIDQPISKSNHFNTFPGGKGKANTFPVDKECCDYNEPCEDHDDSCSYDYLYDDDDRYDGDEYMQQTNNRTTSNILKNNKVLSEYFAVRNNKALFCVL